MTDLFFVGFGSDAAQDVFMREVGHVQRAMNKNLGASGRSVVLINNLKTIDTTPARVRFQFKDRFESCER